MYGYQNGVGRQLTQLGRLNYRMDIEAKNIARVKIMAGNKPSDFTPTSIGFVSIKCGSVLVTSRIQSTPCNYITHEKAIDRLRLRSETCMDLNQCIVH